MHKQVTILIYTFPEKGNEATAFKGIVASIERTWKNVGKLKTVIVASHHFAEADSFASQHSTVELQIEPTLMIDEFQYVPELLPFIKMSANPGTDAMRHFAVIDEMGAGRAPGCALSLTQNPIPVRDKGFVVNLAALRGRGSTTKNVTGIIPPDVDAKTACRAHFEEKCL